MGRLDLLCLLWWFYGIAVMPQLTQAAFHPLTSPRVRVSGVSSGSGSQNYYRPISENEGKSWRVGADHDFRLPENSEAILEMPSRKSTQKLSKEGCHPEQPWGSTSQSWKGGSGGEPKRARLEVGNWATNQELMESFWQSTEDQAGRGDHCGFRNTGPGLTLIGPSLTELDWDLIWNELETLEPIIPSTLEANLPEKEPDSQQEHLGHSLETPTSKQLLQEAQMDYQFNAMLKRHQPKGIPSPLSGIEPPIIRLEATLDQRKEPKYARLAEQYVQKFQPQIRGLGKYQFNQDFWMGPARKGVSFPEGGLIIGPLDPKETMAMAVPLNSGGNLFEIDDLNMMLKELHKWIIHTHGLLCDRFKTVASAQPDLENLEFWLLREVFVPKKGLPVIGRFSTEKLVDRNFGAVQEWIVKYLVEKESVVTTSLAILAIWFRNTCTKQWKRYFRSDDYFWAHAATLLPGDKPDLIPHDKAEPVKEDINCIAVDNESENSFKKCENNGWKLFIDGDPEKVKIGNFQLLDMTLNPPHIPNPKGRMAMMSWMSGPHKWKIDQGLSCYAQSILDRYAEVSANELGGIQRWHKVFPSERVVIARFRNGALCVRHLLQELDRDVLEHQWFRRKLKKLLSYLDISSLAILTTFSSVRPAPQGVPLQASFFDFLSRKLFGAATEPFFPLFGTLDKTIADLATSPAFDEVQLYLLKVFHDESPFKYLEAALTLLGYWLKNENQYFWDEHIKSDQFYSQFIISALPKKFTNLLNDPPRQRQLWSRVQHS
ncbi:hypothetical protein PGT21_014444 [Puccinia graminis f. sp. tritici]|uniref:Uncharacterized protein n=1 Tax=Puccinia graminis f. sp. tritici TaxID=56615 RepID=A0A5B0LIH0_PUCGR|nr:hypothetical protein PGTUg99_008234 [Puccinia graminis f. sp. tritici]KAA1092801.1 hypothetical protein PGT21_014444 [Puccinia graminis f. sp. tritici]